MLVAVNKSLMTKDDVPNATKIPSHICIKCIVVSRINKYVRYTNYYNADAHTIDSTVIIWLAHVHHMSEPVTFNRSSTEL